MKKTDYAVRAADFDSHLMTRGDQTGIEIGVDVGAHAEALLQFCPIHKLYLVDTWEKDFYRGYCEGRLLTKGYGSKVEFIQRTSLQAATYFRGIAIKFHFIYIDQLHDYESVKNDLYAWWDLLHQGGILGYRNYAASNAELKQAVDEFVEKFKIRTQVERGEIVLFK